MATPENTLLTRADFTTTAIAATKRKTLTADATAVEIGDTGVRDLSGLLNMTYLDSARLLLIRDGDDTQLHLVDIKVKAGAPAVIIIMTNDRTGTVGFKPPYVATGRAIAATGNGTASLGASADVYVNTALGVVMHGATPGLTYQASVRWLTYQAWPNVLPGVADGDPIGV